MPLPTSLPDFAETLPSYRASSRCLGIWATSADNGPLSRDLGCICGRWPIVSGSGPYLRTLAHCLGIWAVSADAGPLSRDLGHICGRWPRHGSPRNREVAPLLASPLIQPAPSQGGGTHLPPPRSQS